MFLNKISTGIIRPGHMQISITDFQLEFIAPHHLCGLGQGSNRRTKKQENQAILQKFHNYFLSIVTTQATALFELASTLK